MTDDVYKYNQARLEKFRQDAQLNALLNSLKPSFRLRTATTLHRLALRLYPDIEKQQTIHRY
jgi:hypothetical protein